MALSSMLTVLLYFLYAFMAADGDLMDVSIETYTCSMVLLSFFSLDASL